MGRIGILGGTFDPPHIGHLILAQEAMVKLDLEKIGFIPAALPPHKGSSPRASPEQRLKMVGLAISDHPRFEVLDIELRRAGPSYTVDTILELRKTWGAGMEVFFLMGSDSLRELPTWREPERLVEICQVVVATRPGSTLRGKFAEGVIILEMPPVGISSTQIRERVRRGEPIRYLVPGEVERYIFQEGLYL
jgi:nicotinate-nucleotide adenylyltransferase